MAYAFNEDRSKVDVYTEDEIDAMDFANDQDLQNEIALRSAEDDVINARIDTLVDHGTGGIDVRKELWTSASGVINGSINLSDDPDNYDCLELIVGDSTIKKIARIPVTGGVADISTGVGPNDVKVSSVQITRNGDNLSISPADELEYTGSWSYSASGTAIPKIYAVYGIKYAQDCSAEVADIRIGAKGAEYAVAGDAVREQIKSIDDSLGNILAQPEHLSRYLYKKDTYIKNDGTEATLAGYDTYKIPVNENDLLHISWTSPFWYQLNAQYVIRLQKDDDTFTNISVSSQHDTWYRIESSLSEGLFLFISGYKYFVVTVYASSIDSVSIRINNPNRSVTDTSIIRNTDVVCKIDKGCAVFTAYYFHYDGTIKSLSGGYKSLIMPVKKDDRAIIQNTGLNQSATFTDFSSRTTTRIYDTEYTMPSDGIFNVYTTSSTQIVDMYYFEKNAVKILSSNVVDFLPVVWVSFGDSITYREAWQPYVQEVLGIKTHVNCGIGSTSVSGTDINAFWQIARLNSVKTANPDFVTILGGANDLVQNPVIGNEQNLVDMDTDTFIGAYSYIIDDLLTWKPSLKIIILGTTWAHNDGVDVRPSGSTLTYKDFSDACELVADYYQLPFIDLWSNSGFNKYTMNSSPYNIYSADHIHPNDAGGKIIAAQVIAKFREVYGIK